MFYLDFIKLSLAILGRVSIKNVTFLALRFTYSSSTGFTLNIFNVYFLLGYFYLKTYILLGQ